MKTKTRSKFLAKTIPVLLTALLFLTACQKPLTKAEKEEQAEETVTFFSMATGPASTRKNTWLKRPDKQVRAMKF